MNILVTGANGQLGRSVRKLDREFEGLTFIYTDIDELDITNKETLRDFFATTPVEYVINCAGYTAVDKAEEEPVMASLVNEKAVENLALCSAEYNYTLVHISTDYVFSGKHYRPYRVDDLTDPQGVYGQTKLAGEEAVKRLSQRGIIIRTSWLYSEFGHNFVKTIRKLAMEREKIRVISDQVGSPTYAGDLARGVLELVSRRHKDPSVFHFSNEGVASWYDLALEIIELSGIPCTVEPIPTEAYPLPAARPFYSVLDTSRFKKTFNYTIPHWKTSMERCIKILAEIE